MKERSRARLADRLVEAAELEHELLCQYLFAAFSLKRRHDEGVTWAQLERMRRWEASILLVARQEMEHLGLVCNLLTAIGEAPHIERPRLPESARRSPLGIEAKLERLTPGALRRFILYERPVRLTPSERALLDAKVPDLELPERHSIAELYAEISALFRAVGKDAFIGPPGAQLATTDVIPVPLRGVTLPTDATIYDITLHPVTDVPSALAVIEQIVEEGEGGPAFTGESHFARFIEIYDELATEQRSDPAFDPARPVLDDAPLHRIEDPTTRAVAELFDLAYMTTLLLLLRYFSQTDETRTGIDELQRAVFFPMMTAVLRPLGELLTELPVGRGAPSPTAGAGFRIERRLALLPHQSAAWALFQFQLRALAAEAKRLAGGRELPAAMRARLELLRENVERVVTFFDADPDVGSGV